MAQLLCNHFTGKGLTIVKTGGVAVLTLAMARVSTATSAPFCQRRIVPLLFVKLLPEYSST